LTVTTRVAVLSGRICAGKTTLALRLAARPGGIYVSTRDVLKEHMSDGRGKTEREALQELGRRLDQETDGRWLRDAVTSRARNASGLVIVDAVRIAEQIEHLAQTFDVVHIHLTASTDVLTHRYQMVRRERPHDREPESYASVSADPTEAQVESLATRADVVIDTGRSGPDETRAAAETALRGKAI
jgi:adenylosuccinate synthase